jgi:hypothetical protein
VAQARLPSSIFLNGGALGGAGTLIAHVGRIETETAEAIQVQCPIDTDAAVGSCVPLIWKLPAQSRRGARGFACRLRTGRRRYDRRAMPEREHLRHDGKAASRLAPKGDSPDVWSAVSVLILRPGRAARSSETQAGKKPPMHYNRAASPGVCARVNDRLVSR